MQLELFIILLIIKKNNSYIQYSHKTYEAVKQVKMIATLRIVSPACSSLMSFVNKLRIHEK